MDKQTRRENMGKNLSRQLKGLIKSENNPANAIAFFAVGLILLAGGIFTENVFFGIIGACCILIELVRIIGKILSNGDSASGSGEAERRKGSRK